MTTTAHIPPGESRKEQPLLTEQRRARLHEVRNDILGASTRVVMSSTDYEGNAALQTLVLSAAHGLDQLLTENARLTTENEALAAALAAVTLERDSAREKVEELKQEASRVRAMCKAAAQEIQEHWEAHCDPEGHGPQTLMNGLLFKAKPFYFTLKTPPAALSPKPE